MGTKRPAKSNRRQAKMAELYRDQKLVKGRLEPRLERFKERGEKC